MAKKIKSSVIKRKPNQLRTLLQLFVMFLLVFFGIFSNNIFPGTEFADIMDRTLGKFFNIGNLVSGNYIRLIESFTIVLFIWMLNKIISWLVVLFFKEKTRKRAGFLLIQSTIKYALIFLGFIFIILAWGVETTTLLASLGLIGLVVSFGAQGLVEDILSGLFLIMENQYQVGDIVLLDDFRGRVDNLGLRTTRFVDPVTLDVRIVNNSEVKSLINLSTEPSLAVCDMSIEYGEDLIKVETLINEHLLTLKSTYKIFESVPKYVGVQELADSAVILRVTVQCNENDKNSVRRILNRELKLLFDRNGINIPFPQLVVHKE
jgi:small conductance mechanosensitive channel